MNDYKKLVNSWGSKERKEDARRKKHVLRKPSKDDLEEGEKYKKKPKNGPGTGVQKRLASDSR